MRASANTKSEIKARWHGNAAVIELLGSHLIGVVIEPRQWVAEVARFLVGVLHEDSCFQSCYDSQNCKETSLTVANQACCDILRDTFHARHLHKALAQHAECTHHGQAPVLDLFGSEVLEAGFILCEASWVPEAKWSLCPNLRLLVEISNDSRSAALDLGSDEGSGNCHACNCCSCLSIQVNGSGLLWLGSTTECWTDDIHLALRALKECLASEGACAQREDLCSLHACHSDSG